LARIDAIFKLVKDRGASDLHLTAGSPPMLRLHGEVQSVEYDALAPDLLEEMMTPPQWDAFKSLGEIDFGYEVPGSLWVRCNILEQREGIAGGFQILPSQIFGVEELGLPESIEPFTTLTKGLVGTPAIRSHIREAKTFQIPSVMQTGKKDGMLLMDDSLEKLVRAGTISSGEARRWAVHEEQFPIESGREAA
jgi:twitching motility protein PilT